MKKYAFIDNSEDYTSIKIKSLSGHQEAMNLFKEEVSNAVNTYTTIGVAIVELEDDGTGSIEIGYDISGDGFSLTFDVEPNWWDEDEEDFDTFFENWLEQQ